MIYDNKFWSERYQNDLDLGMWGLYIRPLQTYFDQLNEKNVDPIHVSKDVTLEFQDKILFHLIRLKEKYPCFKKIDT